MDKPSATYVDPAGNSVNSHTSETEVKVLRRHGISCRSKSSGVRKGCVLLMDALADPKLPLVVASSCTGTIEAFASVPPRPTSAGALRREESLHAHPRRAALLGREQPAADGCVLRCVIAAPAQAQPTIA